MGVRFSPLPCITELVVDRRVTPVPWVWLTAVSPGTGGTHSHGDVVFRGDVVVVRLHLGFLPTFVGAGSSCSRSGTTLKEATGGAFATLLCFDIL